MADRRMSFMAPMIRALLDGRKNQTRRILNPQPAEDFVRAEISAEKLNFAPAYLFGTPTHKMLRRVIRPGERVVVGESWKPHSLYDRMKPRDMPATKVFYLADGGYSPSGSRGRPGMHMPRWASRLTFVVTETRIQRVQEISEDDARAEGCFVGKATGRVFDSMASMRLGGQQWRCARAWYADLFDAINGPDAWAANPWVVAYTGTVHRCNVDALKETI